MNINEKIEKIFYKNRIKKREILQVSFGIICEKLVLENNNTLIAKYYQKNNYTFNAITAESNSLKFLNKLSFNFFPKIYYADKDVLIINYIDHDQTKPLQLQQDFLEKIINIHSLSNSLDIVYFA